MTSISQDPDSFGNWLYYGEDIYGDDGSISRSNTINNFDPIQYKNTYLTGFLDSLPDNKSKPKSTYKSNKSSSKSKGDDIFSKSNTTKTSPSTTKTSFDKYWKENILQSSEYQTEINKLTTDKEKNKYKAEVKKAAYQEWLKQ